MSHFNQNSFHRVRSALMGASLSILTSIVANASDLPDNHKLFQGEDRALKAYNRSTQISTSIHSFQTEADRGHIPSKISLLQKLMIGFENDIKNIEGKKQALTVKLHENQVLVSAYNLVNLERKVSHLCEAMFNVQEEIRDWQDILDDLETKGLEPYTHNAAWLPWSEMTDCCFLDDSDSDEDISVEEKDSTKKPKVVSKKDPKDFLQTKLTAVNGYFDWRLRANERIIKKLSDLSKDLLTTSFKRTALAILKLMETKAAHISQRINEKRLYLSSPSTTNEVLYKKIDLCQLILHEDPYPISSLILECMDQYVMPENFMSSEQQNDLKMTLSVFYDVFKIDDPDEVNNTKLWISQKFMASHDRVCQQTNIHPTERLVKLMLTMGMASKQMQLVNYKHCDIDEDFLMNLSLYQNSIESIEGKYVSWCLDQKYPVYGHILFLGRGINHELLNFYRFSQNMKEKIDRNGGVGIMDVLMKSREFQLPIVQRKQAIFVHISNPYVVRVKAKGQYTIGLIKMPYDISKNLQWFSLITFSSGGIPLGNCYDVKSYRGQYPQICDPANEILKLSYLCSQNFSSSHLCSIVIPANKEHALGWKANCPLEDRNNMMGKAHFVYN